LISDRAIEGRGGGVRSAAAVRAGCFRAEARLRARATAIILRLLEGFSDNGPP